MLRVKEIAKEKGISLSDVAKKMGMTAAGLSMALNRNLTIDVLKRIAEALDVEISDLFSKEKQNTIVCPNCGEILQVTKKEDL